MAAIDIRPYMEVTTSSATTGGVTHAYKVSVLGSGSANKRWLIDLVEIEFGTAAANNSVDIQFDVADAGAPANIWPNVSNFNYHGVHFSSRYPRAIEMEENDSLEIVFTRGTSSSVGSTVYLLESDI